MKRGLLMTLVGGLFLMSAQFVNAQGIPGTLVQQTPTRLDSATQSASSATSAATLTLTPNGGEYVYIYAVDVANCAGASNVVAAAPTTITTTNISGSLSFTLGSGTTAGQCTQFEAIAYPTGLKSQTSGVATTFILPTFATNQTVRLNVIWRSAP